MMIKYLLIVVCVLVSGDVKVFADSVEFTYEDFRCLLLGGFCAKFQKSAHQNRLTKSSALCNAGSVDYDFVPRSPICRDNGGICLPKETSCLEGITGVTECNERQKCCTLF